jgi:uncharacterized protein YndB with AHSA1/START domain
MSSDILKINPELDLVIDRTLDVPVDAVWRAWTEPELLKQWFTPAPWKTVECAIDLRPGGAFRTVMQSPEGQQFPGDSCYLLVEPRRRLVWTSGMLPGFRPVGMRTPTAGHECDELLMTAFIDMRSEGTGTRYVVSVLHSTAAGKTKHEQMGFFVGWGTAMDQMIALLKRLPT